MSGSTRFRWRRIVVAVFAAEALPILLLILIVILYGLVRSPDSPPPEDFAPRAGNWVGPIGGFLATCLFAWWAARKAPQRRIAHGAAVGLGTAVLDFGLGLLLGGGGAIEPVFFLSNGGWLAARRRDLATSQPSEPSP